MTFLLILLGIILAILLAILFCFILLPYQSIRVLVFIIRHVCYTVRLDGMENVPQTGPALFLANHVSILDALILIGLSKRRIHFLMQSEFYNMKYFHLLFKRMGVIQVPPAGHPKQMRKFLERIRTLLRQGEFICVFPEGGVSGNGLIMQFKNGFSRMLPDDIEVPTLPVRIGMLWGSILAFHNGKLRFSMPHQFPIPVAVAVGKPVKLDLTPFQLHQIISEMGADVENEGFPSERTIHYSFARRVKRRPFHCSFKDANVKGSSDFMMLVKALLLSTLLRKLIAERNCGKYIGVFLPNCTNMVAVLYAILYADHIPAVLNYSVGEGARNASIQKADIKLILTSRKFLDKLRIPELPNMFLLEDLAPMVTKSLKFSIFLDVLLQPSRLLLSKYAPLTWRDTTQDAVLLFSSGSTGIPKGIMLTHHNLNADFFNFWRICNWTPKDTVVGNLPLFHAFGFMIGFALQSLCGTRVTYLVNPLDAQGICNAVEKDKLTLLIATPTFLQTYLRKLKPHQFDSLRLIITGAEKLRADIANKVKELTGLTVTEGFGCTELSPIVAINLSYSQFTLGKECGRPGSVGAPLPGIHVKIVDPDTMEELPENTPGLMLVKGGLVMKGYLNDPELTAKVIKDGYYNTGDIAYMSPDGYITISGRLSRFSKIAGEMVPHEVVEMHISEIMQSEDRSIAVTGAKDAKRGEKVIVFYSNPDLDPEFVIAELQKREMAPLWIPKKNDFIKLDKIPLLGTGKIDLQKINKLALEYGDKFEES